MTMACVEVKVRKKRGGCRFVCDSRRAVFRCGYCLRGLLGPRPKRGAKCLVCKAYVSDVRFVENGQ
jgi:hypothetical protein